MLWYAMLCYAMLCYAMLCYATLRYATLRYAMPCHAMPCHAMPCHAMPCHAMPCRTVPYRTAPHRTAPHRTVLHYTTLHYTTLHYTTLHYTTLHYTTLHYTTLHYTILYYTVSTQTIQGYFYSCPSPWTVESTTVTHSSADWWDILFPLIEGTDGPVGTIRSSSQRSNPPGHRADPSYRANLKCSAGVCMYVGACVRARVRGPCVHACVMCFQYTIIIFDLGW